MPTQSLRALLLVLLPALVAAQERVIRADGASLLVPGAPAAQGTPPQPVAQDQDPQKAQRLQKLQQATFERRPSAILKAWATPWPPKPAEDATKTQAAPPGPQLYGPPARPGPDPFDVELAGWQRAVTLGQWASVKAFLAGLAEDERKAAYQRLLALLAVTPPPDPKTQQPQGLQHLEQHFFALDDVLALAWVAPLPLDDAALASLGQILNQALARGPLLAAFVARLQEEIVKAEAERALTQRQAARLLAAAGHAAESGAFLPGLEQAAAAKDHEALNLLCGCFLARHGTEPKAGNLERAWSALLAIFASGEIEAAHKEKALATAVELAPRIAKELGQRWLEESFTRSPERGMEIIASIGAAAALGLQAKPLDAEQRLKVLRLQATAVNALLAAAPERADSWREALGLCASSWLREAEHSYHNDQSTRIGPLLQRDRFGNFFYIDEDGGWRGPQQPLAAIRTADLLESRPSDAWVERLHDSVKPKVATLFAQLWLKVQEDAKAFPYVERLAGTHPELARDLVKEVLRVWTRNHDPNEARNRTNPYMFMYGYEQRAEGIPLTRSKQERNLVELAELVRRLRALPLGGLDEELVARAFTTCHSSAEVYRLEAIEEVFGDLEAIAPKTLAELVQQMRANLATSWREPAVQERQGTKRKKPDIDAALLRGYTVAGSVVEQALERYPDDWGLMLAQATLAIDLLAYQRELARSSQHASLRVQAFAAFERAAELYAAAVGTLPVEEETTKVYEHWLYASLGAADLAQVTAESLPDATQAPQIRERILALPGEAAERHMAMFANTLFTRLSAVKPACKERYLRCGFAVVGEHKQAYEARKVFDYYRDLVTEIRLVAAIDGSDVVGEAPFGVLVTLRHTREIERESGGFGRYLQNQNNVAGFSYNYGRPTENYRDKFQEAAQQALGEHFEVLSVTFESDSVRSREAAEDGWRVTPYAYLLLKARGPQVDRLPSLRLDLDFLDTSGYVILPIESPPVPLIASAPAAARPVSGIEVTQILDERQAKDGKLMLELKATGQGLLPPLQELVELAPPGFDIVKTDDQGLSVAKFADGEGRPTVLSERGWMVTLRAAEGKSRPAAFRFGTVKGKEVKAVHQRYADADLVTVAAEVPLEQTWGSPSRQWLWGVAVGVVLLLGLGVWLVGRRRQGPAMAAGPRLPATLTPFTVIGLLRELERRNGFDAQGRAELLATIARLEASYFAPAPGEAQDLAAVARQWLERAGR